MVKRTTLTPFLIAERAVISLYDGGVLSPAVLERVIGAFAQAGVDWQFTPISRAVDGRALHEIVVSTMMPGAVPESTLGLRVQYKCLRSHYAWFRKRNV
ncbi:hypothetical protein [Paraburkholderia fungorum]|uniref:hypothetical protein n=1 Tax=Paraburkholderia fungorum TaxID=134537 RepID=UPI0038BB9A11